MTDGIGPLLLALAILMVAVAVDRRIRARNRDLREKLKRALDERRQAMLRLRERQAENRKSTTDALKAQADADTLERQIEDLEAEIAEMEAHPRERIHVFDRNAAREGPLWTALVERTAFPSDAHPGYAASWRAGRRYLLHATNERDARQRCEMKFPSVQGYGIRSLRPMDLAALGMALAAGGAQKRG